MTPLPSKKFIRHYISLPVFVIGVVIVISCVSYPEGNRVLSLFAPEVMGPTRFQPFFFTLDSAWYHYSDKDSIYSETQANAREWKNHFKNAVSLASVKSVVYNYDLSKFPKLADCSVDTNGCLQWMLKNNDEESFDYLKFARRCEPYLNPNRDSIYVWDYSSFGQKLLLKNQAEKAALLKEGMEAIKNAKSDFIRLRYGYQIVRLACYNLKYKECIDYYDKYVEPIPSNSIIKYWALSLKARALYKCGAPQYAKYCYGIIFDRCNTRRQLAKQGFFWAEMYGGADQGGYKYPDRIQATDYCKNRLEKIPLYALEAMPACEEHTNLLDSIYQIDPKSEMLEWLLTRGINQREFYILPDRGRDWFDQSDFGCTRCPSIYNYFSTDSMYIPPSGIAGDVREPGYGYSYDNEDRRTTGYYQPVFTAFVSRCARSNSTRSPVLWNLAAAYLHCLNGNYVLAKSFLANANTSTDAGFTGQKAIIDLLIQVRELRPAQLDTAKENQIAEAFKVLNQCTPPMRSADARSALMLQLSAKYAQKGDGTRAQLCEAASSWSMNLREEPDKRPLDAMIAFALKKDKTPFERLIAHSAATNLDDLYEMKGTVLLTQYKFKEAKAAFDKSHYKPKNDGQNRWPMDNMSYMWADYHTATIADPFMIHTWDCHDCDYHIADSVLKATGKKITYTKSQFAGRMAELETKATTAQGEDLGQTCFLLANGYYNMSYFGNNWVVTEYPYHSYWFTTYEWLSPKEVDDERKERAHFEPFFDCSKAREYYGRALAATHDKEFAARCCFMIAKCDRNDFYTKGSKGQPDRTWFKKLKGSYADTKFYAQALKECEYFRVYAAKN